LMGSRNGIQLDCASLLLLRKNGHKVDKIRGK